MRQPTCPRRIDDVSRTSICVWLCLIVMLTVPDECPGVWHVTDTSGVLLHKVGLHPEVTLVTLALRVLINKNYVFAVSHFLERDKIVLYKILVPTKMQSWRNNNHYNLFLILFILLYKVVFSFAIWNNLFRFNVATLCTMSFVAGTYIFFQDFFLYFLSFQLVFIQLCTLITQHFGVKLWYYTCYELIRTMNSYFYL